MPAVQVLHVRCASSQVAELSRLLFERGAQGVEERESTLAHSGTASRVLLIVYAGEEELAQCAAALAHVEGSRAEPGFDFEQVELGEDWAWKWTHYLEPLALTESLTLYPLASDGDGVVVAPATVTDEILYLEAGLAFGYGDHPTTRMAARWLEKRCAGVRVLDFGTGTGVLALVALRFGAEFAKGTDIDEESLSIARRNAQLNRLDERCKFSAASLDELTADFGVVVANVDVKTLCANALSLVTRLRPLGHLIVTGVTTEQLEPLSQAFQVAGVPLQCIEAEDSWVLLHGQMGVAHLSA
ncbi:MAG: hypothetical protein RJA70_2712 [Pseudomonadota bacterium]